MNSVILVRVEAYTRVVSKHDDSSKSETVYLGSFNATLT